MSKLFHSEEPIAVLHYSAEEFVDIYKTSSVVSTESVNDYFAGIKDKLSTLTQSLTTTTDKALLDATSNQYEVKGVLKRIHFSDLANENVTVPERFQGKYSDYVKALLDASKDSIPEAEQALNNLKMAVSSFINEYSEDGVLTVYGKRYLQAADKVFHGHQTKLATFFPIKKSTAISKVKEVVSSNGDIEKLFSSVKELEAHINLNKIKAISKQSKELSEMVDVLIDLNTRSGILLRNTDAKRDLVEMIHIGARAVEFSGYLYANTIYLYNAVKALSEVVLVVGKR